MFITDRLLQVERSDASNFVECIVYSREKVANLHTPLPTNLI